METPTLILTIFSFVGLLGFLVSFQNFKLGLKSKSWPVVKGVVTQSEIISLSSTTSKNSGSRTMFQPEIKNHFLEQDTLFSKEQIVLGSIPKE